MTFSEFLENFQKQIKYADGFMVSCPGHNDKKPSLHVSEKGGKILIHCHAGCTPEEVLTAMGLQMADLFIKSKRKEGGIEAEYGYVDEGGTLLFQTVRYTPKNFRQRRPDGKGGWIWNLRGVRRVLYRLPQVLMSEAILVVEGEKDADSAAVFGFVATCNPCGAGKWRPEYSEALRGKRVTIIADADPPGLKHARDVASFLMGVAASVKLIEALPESKDLSEYFAKGGSVDRLYEIFTETPELTASVVAKWKGNIKDTDANPWSAAETLEEFLTGGEDIAKFLDKEKRLIARGNVTQIFAPRGLGKSLFAMWLALDCARRGLRVLLLDRDNPPRVVRDRISTFGGDNHTVGLKVLTRDKCPPLTKPQAWAVFPYGDYDLVILDSLDSATEGVGEKDSSQPSKAIASLLDIARRENGPAVLILGNTIKSGKHSRGSGVVEDRADIIYEVRDATDFLPTGNKPSWVEELPYAGVAGWVFRSSRRRQKSSYRLAFIPTKFRIAEEPEPFIVEIDVSKEPWSVKDVTDLVDLEGAAQREERAAKKKERVDKAATALVGEIKRRAQVGEPPMAKGRDAEKILTKHRLTRQEARDCLEARNNIDWEFSCPDGRTINVVEVRTKKKRRTAAFRPPRKS